MPNNYIDGVTINGTDYDIRDADAQEKLKNKVDVVIDNASGSIASFSDGADGMPMEVTVGIEPVQDLHGYDNPWPAGGGVNKFNLADSFDEGEEVTINGVTAKYSNGYLKVTGSNNSGSSFNVIYKTISGALGAGTYISPHIKCFIRASVDGGSNTNYQYAFTAETSVSLVAFYVNVGPNDTNLNLSIPMMIASGTNRPTSYAPYSNICPISGWTGANVTRTGKNLFDYTKITVDRRIDTTNGNAVGVGSDTFRVSDYIRVKQNTKYTLNFSYYSSGNYGMAFYNKSKAFISGLRQGAASGTTPFTFTTPSNTEYIRFTTVTSDISTNAVQCEEGDSATSFEQYRGSTYPITFPSAAGTVYGGTLTVNDDGTGKLVVDRAKIIYNGSENDWTDYASYEGYYITNLNMKNGTRQDGISNLLKNQKGSTVGQKNTMWLGVNSKNVFVIGVYETMGSTLQDFKSYLNANNLEIVYPLATPVTYNLTDLEVIETLKGLNNVWADTGDVSADYPADTKLYISKELSATQKMLELIVTANREESMKATKAYSTGNLLIVNGTLYKATTSIANGATLTVGTNVTATTVASELAALA